jgi:hypothetical protein
VGRLLGEFIAHAIKQVPYIGPYATTLTLLIEFDTLALPKAL